jgi:hypothetical protein
MDFKIVRITLHPAIVPVIEAANLTHHIFKVASRSAWTQTCANEGVTDLEGEKYGRC